MDNLIGCWISFYGDATQIINAETGDKNTTMYKFSNGEFASYETLHDILAPINILRTHQDWQVTDSDGTVWEAWEDGNRELFITANYDYWVANDVHGTYIRQICAAMHIPIQPWEVRKQWED